MKALSCLGAGLGVAVTLTKEDYLFILGVAVTILNLLIEYLKSRKTAARERDRSKEQQ